VKTVPEPPPAREIAPPRNVGVPIRIPPFSIGNFFRPPQPPAPGRNPTFFCFVWRQDFFPADEAPKQRGQPASARPPGRQRKKCPANMPAFKRSFGGCRIFPPHQHPRGAQKLAPSRAPRLTKGGRRGGEAPSARLTTGPSTGNEKTQQCDQPDSALAGRPPTAAGLLAKKNPGPSIKSPRPARGGGPPPLFFFQGRFFCFFLFLEKTKQMSFRKTGFGGMGDCKPWPPFSQAPAN